LTHPDIIRRQLLLENIDQSRELMATLGLFCMTVYPMQATAVVCFPTHQSRHFHGYERLQGYWALRPLPLLSHLILKSAQTLRSLGNCNQRRSIISAIRRLPNSEIIQNQLNLKMCNVVIIKGNDEKQSFRWIVDHPGTWQ
jgi:hypothetical protein